MKQQKILLCAIGVFQPPSGGCVLKLFWWNADVKKAYQPPSGGCVLKQGKPTLRAVGKLPAAFGRLCVETVYTRRAKSN